MTKHYPVQNVSSAEAERPCPAASWNLNLQQAPQVTYEQASLGTTESIKTLQC